MPPVARAVAPDVAIVVTTHNESDLVAVCLRSIQDQSWTGWECVVMDDASTDDTVAVARRAVAGDPRFRIIVSDRNSGISRQRNAGAAATTARWITFLDGDDFLYPEAIESRVTATASEDHPALGGVFCNWVEVAEDSRPGDASRKTRPSRVGWLKDRSRVTWLKGVNVEGGVFPVSAPVLLREAFAAVGGFRSVAKSEDVELWHRMLRRGFFFEGVKEVGFAYRQRSGSMLRRGAIESARMIADTVAASSDPLEADIGVGPFVFREPYFAYPPRMIFVRRLVRALAFEASAGGDLTECLREIERTFEVHMEWTLDLDRVVSSTARLAALASASPAVLQTIVEQRLRDALQPLIVRSRGEAEAWRTQTPETALDTGDVRRTEVRGSTG
jgi:glycosyltransferase involved in cell wall biosynthesis